MENKKIDKIKNDLEKKRAALAKLQKEVADAERKEKQLQFDEYLKILKDLDMTHDQAIEILTSASAKKPAEKPISSANRESSDTSLF